MLIILQLIDEKESKRWFDEIIPALARLLLKFPSLLEEHFHNADIIVSGIKTGLRLLGSQQAGIVFLSQVQTYQLNVFFLGYIPES